MRIALFCMFVIIVAISCAPKQEQTNNLLGPRKFKEIRPGSVTEQEFHVLQDNEFFADSIVRIRLRSEEVDFVEEYQILKNSTDTMTFKLDSRIYESHFLSSKDFVFSNDTFKAKAYYIEKMGAQDTDVILFIDQNYTVYKIKYIPSQNLVVFDSDEAGWSRINSWQADKD